MAKRGCSACRFSHHALDVYLAKMIKAGTCGCLRTDRRSQKAEVSSKRAWWRWSRQEPPSRRFAGNTQNYLCRSHWAKNIVAWRGRYLDWRVSGWGSEKSDFANESKTRSTEVRSAIAMRCCRRVVHLSAELRSQAEEGTFSYDYGINLTTILALCRSKIGQEELLTHIVQPGAILCYLRENQKRAIGSYQPHRLAAIGKVHGDRCHNEAQSRIAPLDVTGWQARNAVVGHRPHSYPHGGTHVGELAALSIE